MTVEKENKNLNPESGGTPPPLSTKANLKRDYSKLWGSFKLFINDILSIKEDTDKASTIDTIKKDIPFKGHTAWVLVCSIMIASIGLNTNSSAVVIGAMLISPLMGPILGIGLSIAINDIDTMRRALKNFGVMVVLSVATAFLFFALFPLREESSELLSRTSPDIRDVLIAFFGGLALIIARTKRGTIASVIFGVAIGTALMPPLCTAGFGLAIGNLSYFWGAMYLFTINTIFILFATYLILKLLRFPMVQYADSLRRRRISQLVSFIAFLVMIPAAWTFYNVFQESLFYKQGSDFIKKHVETVSLSDGRFISGLTEMDYQNKKSSSIELVFIGDGAVNEDMRNTWLRQMQDYPKLTNTNLVITQGRKSETLDNVKYIEELYNTSKQASSEKDNQIRELSKRIVQLESERKAAVPLREISENIKIFHQDLVQIEYAEVVTNDFNRLDTINLFTIHWEDKTSQEEKEYANRAISEYLKKNYSFKNLKVNSPGN